MKLVLPSLVEGVDSRTWRSKQGSVQMLGAMAYCAPKQLGTALPSIVPKLSEILADPHPKVQSAARQALKEVSFQTSSLQLGMRRKFLPCLGLLVCTASRHDQLSCGKVCGKKDIRTSAYACLCPTASNCISRAVCVLQVGSVIRNAEVQELVPALLAAIADPNNKAKPALDTLLVTKFVNTVDAASLALIVPVVHRGLRDRSGDVKKKAARIVGNMCGLINEPKVSGQALSLSLSLSLARARSSVSAAAKMLSRAGHQPFWCAGHGALCAAADARAAECAGGPSAGGARDGRQGARLAPQGHGRAALSGPHAMAAGHPQIRGAIPSVILSVLSPSQIGMS